MHIDRHFAALLFVLAVAAGTSAQAQTQPPATANTALQVQDPAADALWKRYESANDPREARRAFDELVALGAKSPRAAYLCGLLAAQEGSVVADRAIALRCLEDAAKAGIAEAQYRLALLLLDAKPVDPKQRAAAEHWLLSAAKELPESVYMVALLRADQSPDPERVRREVVDKAAQAGYAPAQYELARRLHAQGSTESKAAARGWLEKAAAQGHGEAAVELALILEADKREQDIPRIVALLEMAAKAGSARGDYALGLRLMDAKGVKRDTERAFELFRRAALRGYVPAMYATGFALSQGTGTGSDDTAAVEWFRRAADRGNADAMFAMGNSYANGWGVGKSMDVAYLWYCKAAQAGSPPGLDMIKRAGTKECAIQPAHTHKPAT